MPIFKTGGLPISLTLCNAPEKSLVPAAGIEPACDMHRVYSPAPNPLWNRWQDEKEQNPLRQGFLEAGLLLNLNPCIAYGWIWEREPAPADLTLHN